MDDRSDGSGSTHGVPGLRDSGSLGSLGDARDSYTNRDYAVRKEHVNLASDYVARKEHVNLAGDYLRKEHVSLAEDRSERVGQYTHSDGRATQYADWSRAARD